MKMMNSADWQQTAFQLLLKNNRKSKVKYPGKCSLFTILHKYVLFPILSEWLSMNELCGLDSALCSVETRPAFLTLISQFCTIPFHGMIFTHKGDYDVIGYLNWLNMRQISVQQLKLCFHPPASIVEQTIVPKSISELTTRLGSVFLKPPPSPPVPSKKKEIDPIHLPHRVEDLSICGVTDENVFDELESSATSHLLRLSLSHFQIDSSHRVNGIIQFIMRYTNTLQELTIHNCKLVSVIAIKLVLQECHQLTRLVIVECRNSSTSKGKYVYPPNTNYSTWAVRCPNLRYVSFFQFPIMNDSFLCHLVSSCSTTLTHITVLQSPISDVSMNAIARLCPQLLSLALETYCSHISDGGIQSIAAHCPHLRCLRINCSDVKWLTTRSIQQVIQQCPDLRYLNCGDVLSSVDCQALAVPNRLKIERTGRLSGLFDACPLSIDY